MKTAISIPEPVFEAAEELAHELGVSRSALYSEAIREYVTTRSRARVTEALDRVYGTSPAHLDETLAAMQTSAIARTEEW
jgi:metal-responsive CopG/Arc/MetJ family transcriptional regulator